MSPLKELSKIIKEFQIPIIKVGLLGNDTLSAPDIVRLSKLPSKDILRGQVVGGLNAPIYGLIYSLNWNIQKLVRTLTEVQKKKSN